MATPLDESQTVLQHYAVSREEAWKTAKPRFNLSHSLQLNKSIRKSLDSSSQQRETACSTYKTPFGAVADQAKTYQPFDKEAGRATEYVLSNRPMKQVKISKLQ